MIREQPVCDAEHDRLRLFHLLVLELEDGQLVDWLVVLSEVL